MKKFIAIMIVVALLALATLPALAVSAQWKLVVRVKGVVENQFQGRGKWHSIWQSRMLKDGDLARTGEDSRAKIRLADNSVISLGENTKVEVSQFKLKKQSRVAKFKLFFGKVRSRVGRFVGKESKFQVKTPNAVLAARGTDFLVEYVSSPTQSTDGGTTKVMVFESSVDLTAGGQTTTIDAGNTAYVTPTGTVQMNPPGYQPAPSGSTGPGTDTDLVEYDPDVAEGSTDGDVPSDPNTGTSTTVGSNPSAEPAPGGVTPPPGNTGTVTVIIHTP